MAVRSRAILRIWAIRFEWVSFRCFFSVPAHVRNCQHLPSTDAVCDFHPGVLHVCHDHIGWCGSNSGWAIDVGLHRLCSWSSILWYDSREQLKKAEEVRILILDDFGFSCKTDRKHVHNYCIYNYIQIYIYIFMMLRFLFALEQSLFTISHYCLLLIQRSIVFCSIVLHRFWRDLLWFQNHNTIWSTWANFRYHFIRDIVKSAQVPILLGKALDMKLLVNLNCHWLPLFSPPNADSEVLIEVWYKTPWCKRV